MTNELKASRFKLPGLVQYSENQGEMKRKNVENAR